MGEAAAVLSVQQIMADVAPRPVCAGDIHPVFKLRNNLSLGALSRQLSCRSCPAPCGAPQALATYTAGVRLPDIVGYWNYDC